MLVEKQTKILQPTAENIELCARALRAGELVAFPTETVYALGAAATDDRAVEKVFEVKGRSRDKALIVAVSDKSRVGDVVKRIPQKARMLMDRFMPGALTLVMDKADCIPSVTTAGGSSVAVRIPDNPVALKLIELAGCPVVVPSANTSDKASPTLASHVLDDLGGRIQYVLDGGASEIGIESTVIDMRVDPPVVLREGGVAVAQIESVIGGVAFKREPSKLSGGYTPNAEVLFAAYFDGMAQSIISRYDELTRRGAQVVIFCLDGNRELYGSRNAYALGKDYKAYAHNLFAALRRADADLYETVIAEGVNPEGIGESLIARLIKLSGGMII